MAKKEFKPLSWLVTYHDCNADKIKYYDILKYREDFIKKLKKKCATKEEFAEEMRHKMMYYYWSKSEWEIVVEIDDNNHIWLNPWVGSRHPEDARIDVTDRADFDWKNFAVHHIGKRVCKNEAKIDVFDQLEWRWDEFIDYVWSYRHKYQRAKKVDAANQPDEVVECDGRCLNCDYYDTSECPDRR
jgi:hypothetical protein